MSDSTFDSLTNIPGHVSSFSSSANDGSILQVSCVHELLYNY